MTNGVILQIVQTTGAYADTVNQALTSIPQPAKPTEISLSILDLAIKGWTNHDTDCFVIHFGNLHFH
jgi:hypothetical protein